MDHTRDNPLKRFTAFWIAILLVFSFGVALLLLRPLTHRDVDTSQDVTAQGRLEVKDQIDRAQNDALSQEAISEAFEQQRKSFSQNTPTKSAMVVPGSAPAPTPAEKPAPTE